MRSIKVKRPNPTNCLYWHDPKHIKSGPLKDRFELLHTYAKGEHHWTYLLNCRDCDQQYLMHFSESIDWINGNDPQFTIYVPVIDQADADAVLSQGMKNVSPRLHSDFPSNADQPIIYWVAED